MDRWLNYVANGYVKLKPGDVLVCDASDRGVRSGETSTRVLEVLFDQCAGGTGDSARHGGRAASSKLRWVVPFLDLEPRLRRVKAYRALPQLRAALLRRAAWATEATVQAA